MLSTFTVLRVRLSVYSVPYLRGSVDLEYYHIFTYEPLVSKNVSWNLSVVLPSDSATIFFLSIQRTSWIARSTNNSLAMPRHYPRRNDMFPAGVVLVVKQPTRTSQPPRERRRGSRTKDSAHLHLPHHGDRSRLSLKPRLEKFWKEFDFGSFSN